MCIIVKANWLSRNKLNWIWTLILFLLQANSEESIRKELVALQEDKHNYESTAKESLKTALEEKLEACRKLSDMEVRVSH